MILKFAKALTILAVASTSAHGFYIAPVASSFKTSSVSFTYPHKTYGNLPGTIEAKDGYAAGLEAGFIKGRLNYGAEASYIHLPLQSVTVGGQLKNWGDSISGYSTGLFARYRVLGPVYVGVGCGYQDVLGGSTYTQVEAGIKKGALRLSVANRSAGASTYEGLSMSKTEQTIVSAKLNWSF